MSHAASALYFEYELAANPAPLMRLLETLAAGGDAFQQWHIPEKRKGPPPSAFNLKGLVARVTKGNTWMVGVETPRNTADADSLFVTAQTTPLTKRSGTLTKCRYETCVVLGARRTECIDAIIAFADAVAARAGAIFVADTVDLAAAIATTSGRSNLTEAQRDRIPEDDLYWQPHWGDVIRGPAWGTFLGVHHVAKLGGISRIERDSGCARVIALGSGGAYLQTTHEPTDDVPEALVRFLEPVRYP